MKPPTNIEAELGVIGCCLFEHDRAMEAVESLSSSSFSDEPCRVSFEVIEKLVAEGKNVDMATFVQQWRASTSAPIPEQIIGSPESVVSFQFEVYVDAVRDNTKRRRLYDATMRLVSRLGDSSQKTDNLIGEAEALLYGEEIKGFPILDGRQCAHAITDELESRCALKGARSGIQTGFWRFDSMTDGLQRGEQTIIAARPSVGKTAIAMNIVEIACLRDKVPTLIVSLEMSERALMRRLLASWGKIEMGVLKSGKLNDHHQQQAVKFNILLAKSPLYLVNAISGIDAHRLNAIVRRAVRRHGIKLVVIDYLQKVKPDSKQEKRTYEVGQVSTSLRSLAVSANIAMLTLAQLNRESEKDKGRLPRISDLADSSQIERDGDVIGLLHRARTKEDPNGRESTLSIGKQRDGEVGPIPLEYEGQFCRFENPQN